MSEKPSVTGIVLAGGYSSRMGRDKALLPWGACTLLEHAGRRLDALCDRVVISSGEPAHAAFGYDIQADLEPGRGPLMGICSVMSSIPGPYYLVLSVDLPFVSQEALALILSLSRGQSAAIPVHEDGKTEPTCACYHRKIFPEMIALLGSGENSLRSLAQLPGTRQIPVSAYPSLFPAGSLVNLNHPKDYEKHRPR